jgi:hypothetical protein
VLLLMRMTPWLSTCFRTPAATGAANSIQAMTMVGMPTRQIISAHEELKRFGAGPWSNFFLNNIKEESKKSQVWGQPV